MLFAVQRDDASDVSMDISDDEDTIPPDQSSPPTLPTDQSISFLENSFVDHSTSSATNSIQFLDVSEPVQAQSMCSNANPRAEDNTSTAYHYIHTTEILQARYPSIANQDVGTYLLSEDQIKAHESQCARQYTPSW